MNFFNEFEIEILNFIQENLRFHRLDELMVLITRLADDGIFWIILALALICFKQTRKMGITMGVALLLGLLIGNVGLKNIFARTRPYDVNLTVELLVERLHDYSFPSGHTLCSFGSAMAMYRSNKRCGVLAFILGSLIAVSRIYLYVHYPTDVICAVLLGIFNGFVAFIIVDKIYKLIENKSSKIRELEKC